MDRKSDQEISVFVRDEETGRLVFNACALQSWGLDPAYVQQRGYPVKPPEVLMDASSSKLEQTA